MARTAALEIDREDENQVLPLTMLEPAQVPARGSNTYVFESPRIKDLRNRIEIDGLWKKEEKACLIVSDGSATIHRSPLVIFAERDFQDAEVDRIRSAAN